MNPLINIKATLYFRISNSQLYGGEGSVGYSSVSFDEIKNVSMIDEKFIEDQKKLTAGLTSVPIENIELISRTEYDMATSEDMDDGEIIYEDDDFSCDDEPLGDEEFFEEDYLDDDISYPDEMLNEEEFPDIES